MTGLSASMDYLYLASRSQNRTYRYSLPGIYGRSAGTRFDSGSKTWDIARDPRGRIWAAVDGGEYSVRCYETDGRVAAGIGRDILSSATGVAIDDGGTLWASNNEDGMIYGLDVSE